jgi:catechol 2,3-dioxygenase-like lactoylglutathione lyase family enzyme
MLSGYSARPTLPALDLARAKRFYTDTLGLTVVDENPGGIALETGGPGAPTRPGWVGSAGVFIYPTPIPTRGGHTQMGWLVDDLATIVAGLRGKGVVFEEYDSPGVKTVDGIAERLDGRGRAAWFKDSEGNLLGLVQFNG